MPELLTFTPCDKVLVDEERNPTLVVLIEKIQANIVEGTTLTDKVIAPKEWVIFAVWKAAAGERGKHYKQVCDLIPPGTAAARMHTEMEFDLAEPIHRTIVRVIGFPVGNAGTASLEIWLEENGSAVTEKVSYPIQIEHKVVPKPKDAMVNSNATTETKAKVQ